MKKDESASLTLLLDVRYVNITNINFYFMAHFDEVTLTAKNYYEVHLDTYINSLLSPQTLPAKIYVILI